MELRLDNVVCRHDESSSGEAPVSIGKLCFLAFVLNWHVWSIPFRIFFIGYGGIQETPLWILLGDILLDIALFLYIALESAIAQKAPQRPFSQWSFWLAVFPLDLLAHVFSSGSPQNYGLWRLNKLIVLGNIVGLYKHIASKTWKWSVHLRRMIGLFWLLTVLCHWTACIWHWIPKVEAQKDGEDVYSWKVHDSYYSTLYQTSLLNQYVRSMYWACITMTTVGFGDIVPVTTVETIFTLFVILTGMTISFATIANITTMMHNKDAIGTAFQKTLDEASECFEARGVSDHVGNKVLAYLRYAEFIRRADEKTPVITELEKQLPKALRQRICREHQHEIFRSIPLFARASDALRSALASGIHREAYAPGDTIVRESCVTDGLYYFRHGIAHISVRGKYVRKLLHGDYFGESSLTHNGIDSNVDCSTYTVTATSFCEVLWLSKEYFQQCLDDYGDNTEVRLFLRHSRAEVEARRSSLASLFDTASSSQLSHNSMSHPDSSFRRTWSMICFAGLLYNLFAVPRDLACVTAYRRFQNSESLWTVIELVIMYVVDFVFILDIVFKCCWFSYISEGVVVYNRRDIRKHYVYSMTFVLDFVAALPLDVFATAISSSLELLPVLRINKVCRLFHLYEHFSTLEGILISKFHIGVFLRRMLTAVLLLFLSGYVAGSIWTFIGLWYYNNSTTPQFSWVHVDKTNPTFYFPVNSTISDAASCDVPFLRGIYFAFIGMSTLGFGDIVPINVAETIYATLLMLYGAIMKPAVVGSIASLLLHRNRPWKEHNQRIHYFNRLAAIRQLPKSLQDRVNRYFDYVWTHKSIEQEAMLLYQLPNNLRAELASSLWNDVLSKVTVFRGVLSDEVLTSLYAAMEPKLYLPSDRLAKAFQILIRGSVSITGSSNDEAIINEGDKLEDRCFGYRVFLEEEEESDEKITAATYVECALLLKKDIKRILWENEREMALLLSQKVERLKSSSVPAPFHHSKIKMLSVKEDDDEATSLSYAHPASSFRYKWEVLMLIVLLYNAVAVPFRFAFYTYDVVYEEGLNLVYSFVPDIVSGMVIVLDFYFKSQCFYVIQDGKLVTTRREINDNFYGKYHYVPILKYCVSVDCIAAITCLVIEPTLFIIALKDSLSNVVVVVMTLSALLKLPKIVTQLPSVVSRAEKKFVQHRPALWNLSIIAKVLLYISLAAHSVGCLWFFVARVQGNAGTSIWFERPVLTSTWVQHQVEDGHFSSDGGSLSDRYIRSIYFSTQVMVVVISGDTVPSTLAETILCILIIFTGVIVSASLIGLVTECVLQVDSRSMKFRYRSDALFQWMKRHYIPLDIRLKARLFMERNIRNHKSCKAANENNTSLTSTAMLVVNEDEVLAKLPILFRDEIIRYTKLERIRNCAVFKPLLGEDDRILWAVANSLRRRVFAPGDVVVHKGQANRVMIFFKPGMAEVVLVNSDKKKIVMSRTSETVFGVRSLLLGTLQDVTVCAADFTEVYILKNRDMQPLYEKFTDLHDMLCHEIIQQNDDDDDLLSQKVLMPTTVVKSVSKNHHHRQYYSLLRFVWDSGLLLSLVYLILMVPLRVAFLVEDHFSTAEIFGGWYIVDIIVHTAYVIDLTKLVNDSTPPTIVDTIATGIPIMTIVILFSCVDSHTAVETIKFILILSLVKVFGKSKCYYERVSNHLLQAAGTSYTYLTVVSRRVLLLLTTVVVITHTSACFWMILHRYAHRHSSNTWIFSDPFNHRPGNTNTNDSLLVTFDGESHNICNDLRVCYVRATYFVMAFISTVGYGDVIPVTNLGYVLRTLEALVAATVVASVVGSFKAFFQYQDDFGYTGMQVRLSELAAYFTKSHLTGLSKETQELMTLNAKLLWSREVSHTKSLTSSLPVPLQMEVASKIKHSVLISSRFLSSKDTFLRNRIALAFTFQVAVESQPIICKGDLLCEVIFISTGRVLLISTQVERNRNFENHRNRKLIYGTLGDHFGRARKGVASHTVRAIEGCEMYVLNEAALRDICDHIPQELHEDFLEELDMTSLHQSLETTEQMHLGIPEAFQQGSSTQQNRENGLRSVNHERSSSINEDSYRRSLTPLSTNYHYFHRL